jgi:hypothetical protein
MKINKFVKWLLCMPQIDATIEEARIAGYKEGFRAGHSHALKNMASNIEEMHVLDDKFIDKTVATVAKSPKMIKVDLSEDSWCDFTVWDKLSNHDKTIIVGRIAHIFNTEGDKNEFTFGYLKQRMFGSEISVSCEIIAQLMKDNSDIFESDTSNRIVDLGLSTVIATEYFPTWWKVMEPIWPTTANCRVMMITKENRLIITKILALCLLHDVPSHVKKLQEFLLKFSFDITIPDILSFIQGIDIFRKSGKSWRLTPAGTRWVEDGCPDDFLIINTQTKR